MAVDVIEETAPPGAVALVGGHRRVHDVDAPFDVANCAFGDTLASADSWDGVGGLGSGGGEGGCRQGGHDESVELFGDRRHDKGCYMRLCVVCEFE